jgi:hypothetical protein
MRHKWYKLVNKIPVATDDINVLEKIEDRIVKQTYLTKNDEKRTLISTVFLGLNHSWDDAAPPVLFETMIFDCPSLPEYDEFQERYNTWYEAEAGHDKLVDILLKEGFSLATDPIQPNTSKRPIKL